MSMGNKFELKPVSKEALDQFLAHQNEIIQESVRRSMLFPEEIEHHGDTASQVITSGYEFTMKMLMAAMETGDRSLLDDQAKWAVRRLPHDKVSIPNLINRLNRLKNVLNEGLKKKHSNEINCYIDYLINKIKEFSERSVGMGNE